MLRKTKEGGWLEAGGEGQRKGMAGFCGWLDVDQSRAERNHLFMESAQHDFMFSGALAKGRERQ